MLIETVKLLKEKTASVVKEDHPAGEVPLAGGSDNSDMGHGKPEVDLKELKEAVREALILDKDEKVLKLVKQLKEIHPDKGANASSIAKQELRTLVLEGKIDEAKASEIAKGIDEVFGE